MNDAKATRRVVARKRCTKNLELKHQRRRRSATATKTSLKKMNLRCFKLYAYSISFNSSNVANFFWR